MRRVYKYPIPTQAAWSARIHAGAMAVHVAVQDGQACLWAEVDDQQPVREYGFAIVGTGHEIPEGGVHLGTWLSGPFVWHLYQVGEGP